MFGWLDNICIGKCDARLDAFIQSRKNEMIAEQISFKDDRIRSLEKEVAKLELDLFDCKMSKINAMAEELKNSKPKKVFVIGSLMASKISKAVEKYWAEGYEVEYAKLDPGRPIHEIIDDTFKKIKDADIIVAVMKSESEKFGEGTLYEIAYARSLGKKVEVLTDNF